MSGSLDTLEGKESAVCGWWLEVPVLIAAVFWLGNFQVFAFRDNSISIMRLHS